jgi:ribosome-associated protein
VDLFRPRRIESFTIEAHLSEVFNQHPRRVAPLTSTLSQVATSAPQAAHAADAHVKLLARGILESLDDAKAEEVLAIELEGKTAMADMMVIATGRSSTHVNAIADRVIRSCKAIGINAKVEGMPQCDWVLLDAGDVIVHVFRPEVRQFYNLEKMWGVDRPSERRTG